MNTSLKELQNKLAELQQQNEDLDMLLTTAIEHGDLVEDELARHNELLHQEIEQRMSAESRLQKLVELITQQKTDLEILVETVVEHSDLMDYSWLEKLETAEHESLTDSLTGIANRRAFDRYYMNEWKRAIRNQSYFSFIMFDVDFFKRFNDLHGHTEGDRCLKAITQTAQQVLSRPSDLLARYGGEEFIIILPDTDLIGATKIADQLLRNIHASKIIHGDSLVSDYVTVSVGVNSCLPNVNSDSVEFLNQTDQLLYQAKNAGRNQVVSPESFNRFESPKVSSYGDFVSLHEYQRLENLSLSYIPSSIPMQQRWRNNGLSADFLADYMSTFFLNDNSEQAKRKQNEISSAVSFISNELLENSMKYTAENCSLPSGINLFLSGNQCVFEAYNYINESAQAGFVAFINSLQNSEPEELYIQKLEENAMTGDSSGLGLLTMINDYQAKLAWKFVLSNKQYIRVTIQVTIDL